MDNLTNREKINIGIAKRAVTHPALISALILCVCLCVLIPISPSNVRWASRDSGVFLYIGQRILHGDLPYRNVWDHKPPVIFYINALGLLISRNSLWGVWLLELISLFGAASIGFYLFKKVFGLWPAIYGLLLWLFALTFWIDGGNFTTEYTIPLQFSALWLFYTANKPNSRLRYWFLIGATGGIAFFTKQTTIGIWIAIIFCQMLAILKHNQTKKRATQILVIALGTLATSIFVMLFFSIQGAFSEFWDAAFKYNYFYAFADAHSTVNRLKAISIIMAYALGLGVILYRKKFDSSWNSLLTIGLIDFPVEILLISLSGRQYPHYYMTILPVLSVFVSLAFWVLFSLLPSWDISNILMSVFRFGLTGILLGVLSWGISNSRKIQFTPEAIKEFSTDQRAAEFISSNTNPGDYVLMWGAESSVNFFTERKSPSRFVYQYPLYTRRYADEANILEFLDDIIQYRPRLIVDTANELTPFFDFPVQTENIKEKIEYIRSHYQRERNLDNWTVYQYTEIDNSLGKR